MELIRIDDKPLHKTCLRCAHCNGTLTLGKYASLKGKFYWYAAVPCSSKVAHLHLYSKPHFKQLFALKGNYSEGFESSADSPTTPHTGFTPSVATPHKEVAKTPSEEFRRSSLVDSKPSGDHFPKGETKVDEIATKMNRQEINKNDWNPTTKNQPVKSTGPVKAFGGNFTSNACPVCSKTVYPMEQVIIDSITMHKSCFRCGHCKGTLKPGNYASLEGMYYWYDCSRNTSSYLIMEYSKPHFKQLFALKGNYSEGFGKPKGMWNTNSSQSLPRNGELKSSQDLSDTNSSSRDLQSVKLDDAVVIKPILSAELTPLVMAHNDTDMVSVKREDKKVKSPVTSELLVEEVEAAESVAEAETVAEAEAVAEEQVEKPLALKVSGSDLKSTTSSDLYIQGNHDSTEDL